MINITARPLTQAERVNFISVYGERSSIPAWGRVYDTQLGRVLAFDSANGYRNLTLISGPDAGTLAAEINKPEYFERDSGFLALVQGIAEGSVKTGVQVLNIAMLVAIIVIVKGLK